MATPAAPPPVEPGEAAQRVLAHGVRWGAYEPLLEALGASHVRTTYDGGSLEILSPSPEHEADKVKLRLAFEIIADECDVEYKCLGATTLRKEAAAKGLEPDERYYLANWRRIAGKKRLDLAIDPPPDLAIEIDVTPSSLDRQGIHAALGVGELWRFDGQTLRVFQLQDDGTYAPRDRSPSFPLLPLDEIERFVKQGDVWDDLRWKRAFRAWVRDQIGHRDPEVGRE
ncbi:MAG TPA: Uma2 family endonuclease [Isosphaeraceae bacterium]